MISTDTSQLANPNSKYSAEQANDLPYLCFPKNVPVRETPKQRETMARFFYTRGKGEAASPLDTSGV